MASKYNAIRDIILKNIPGIGNYPTSINGVRFVRRNNPTEFVKCFYNPSCILVLQGRKHMLYGHENIIYTKGQYVVSCTDIPVSSRVIEASEDHPFVVLILELDSNIISSLILEIKLVQTPMPNTKALAIADADDEILDVFYRLALLIEKSQTEQQIMAPIIIKEIYYRLLTGALGSQLRLINTKGTRSHQIAQAISLIKEHYCEKLDMAKIAQQINMAPASFYRNFKKVTKVSPLQFQKQLKLNEAQRLMLSGECTAESASYIVGYESPTQFSREYKKMFGSSPKKDIQNLNNSSINTHVY